MSTVPTPNGVRCELIFNYQGVRWENVYCVTKGSPALAADLPPLWTLLRTWHNGYGRSSQHTTCALVQIDLTALDGPGAPVYSAPLTPAIYGPVTGTPCATFISAVAKHNTNRSGRSYRGRTHCGGFSQSAVAGNLLQAAGVSTLETAFLQLRTQLLAGGWTFVVLSQYSGVQIVNGRRRAIPRAQGIMTAIVSTTVEGAFDTQRHRKYQYLA